MTDERGFLTRTDELFLRGDKHYNRKQQRYDRRTAIANRTREAFHDFAKLYEHLDESERNRIFDPPADEVGGLMNSMTKMIAFVYHSLEGDAGSNTADWRSFRYPFAAVLEGGVRMGESARHESDDQEPWAGLVDVEFSVDTYSPQELDRERAVEELVRNGGRGLSEGELRTLVAHAARDTISPEAATSSHTIDGEPVEERFNLPEPGFRGLAEEIERKAAEIHASEDGK